MKLLLLQFVIFGLATAAFADDSQLFLITTNQAAEVRQKLDAYENGKLTLQNLTENAGTEGCRELIGYYLLHTNEISTKSLLPVSRAYAFGGIYPEAAQLARQYVNVYSNDWHGWRILGGACLLTKSYNESIYAYKNAVRLGDRDSYQALGGAAIQANQPEVIGEIVPNLMTFKTAKETSEKDRLNYIAILLAYAVMADRKDVFVKTLDGEDIKQIMQRSDIKEDIVSGCKYFEGKDIAKIRQEMESATSSTNSVSSPPR